VRQTLRKCLALLDNDKRGRFVALIALNATAGALEAVGALLVLAVLTMIGGEGQSLELPLVGSLQERFPGTDEQTLLVVTSGIVAAFFVVRAAVLIAQQYFQARIAHNAGLRLSSRLLRHYLAQPFPFHAATNSAVLIRNATNAVQSVVGETFVPLIIIASEAIVVVGLTAVLLLAAPVATIGGGLFVATVAYLTNRLIRPRLRDAGAVYLETGATSYYTLQQALQGVREVKLLHRESYFADAFDASRVRWAKSLYNTAALSNSPRVVMETMFVVGLAAFAAIAGASAAPEETLALFGLFAYSVLRILPAVNRIVFAVGNLQFGGASVDEVYAELRRMEAEGTDWPATPRPRSIQESVELRDVSFVYSGRPMPALQEVNLSIPRGAFIGIAGPTGSGKSTLLDILIGLQVPTSGSVTIDGVELRDDVRGWQASLGVVSQAVYVLDDTLRRNIAFGVPDDEVDEAAVLRAVAAARLEELVASLPEGLDTSVGEHGVRFSGGQRQRLAIARAIYRDPEVIVFDEGTSALDRVTEEAVMAALEELRQDRTIIAVAHRLTTLRSCTQIVLLEAGRIVDRGTYDELLARNRTFRSMAS